MEFGTKTSWTDVKYLERIFSLKYFWLQKFNIFPFISLRKCVYVCMPKLAMWKWEKLTVIMLQTHNSYIINIETYVTRIWRKSFSHQRKSWQKKNRKIFNSCEILDTWEKFYVFQIVDLEFFRILFQVKLQNSINGGKLVKN